MGTDDKGQGGGIHAPAATQGARAICDILEALAARVPERPPAERRVTIDDPPQE